MGPVFCLLSGATKWICSIQFKGLVWFWLGDTGFDLPQQVVLHSFRLLPPSVILRNFLTGPARVIFACFPLLSKADILMNELDCTADILEADILGGRSKTQQRQSNLALPLL